MGSTTGRKRRAFAVVLAASMICQNFGMMGSTETVQAADAKIEIAAENIKAKSASEHGADLIVDGDTGTYWQSVPQNGEGDDAFFNKMYDHNRYIDITLDGTYELSEIKIFNREGSYNNYYIYASSDGVNYDKIVSKTSREAAKSDGDSHILEEKKKASSLRLNMAYNSGSYETNLAEIEVYGTKLNDDVPQPDSIKVENWKDSKWKTEWDKFEKDAEYAKEKTLKEMSNLVGRVVGDQWKSSFRFEMRNSLEEGKDIFEIKDGSDGTIVIRGNSGIAMASGFNYYLRNYVNIDYSPMWGSNTELKEIKQIGSKIVREAQFDIRYALNFCTYSYTMAFWNWDEYEEFLDWSAMNGLNLILDIVGQEEVLRQTLREFNYTDDEIKDYLCGPSYFAWFYMQNLYSQGGPLPDSWFEERTELGRKIHDRMQTYGINPVIQAFGGQVPDSFPDKNEHAIMVPAEGWSGFARPAIVKPYLTNEDVKNGARNYFSEVAKVFYEKQKNVFGNVSHYYAADPFHEGATGGGLDRGKIFLEVQNELLESDEKAIWVMQQWQNNIAAGNADKLTLIDRSKILALDLQSDMRPQHASFEVNGTPWVYCMLHNFGGRMGVDGEIPVIASNPIETFQSSKNMKGIGMTPEAMENSPAVYELLFDTTWSKDPINYKTWLKKFSERRAGGESKSLKKAWDILLKTAYADKTDYIQGAAETVINVRPTDNFSKVSSWGHSTIPYNKKELDQALLLLAENFEAFKESPAYKYDLAEVTEQVLCNAAVEYHSLMVQAKNENDLKKFEKYSSDFLNLIDLSDRVLSTTDEFMLGTWINASRKMITNADDWTKDLFEFNARALITTWAGQRPCNEGGLRDYSNRKWAGLTKTYYKARWEIWIRNRIAELKGEAKDPTDQKAESNWFMWEFEWVNRKSDDDNGAFAFTTEPSEENLEDLAKQAYNLYSCTNIEKNTGGTALETENVAEGKTVMTSSQTKEGDPANITDGTTGTEWVAEGAGPHILELDLDKEYDVNRITLSTTQTPGNYLYTWKVEYYDAKTSGWQLLKEDNTGKVLSNTDITNACTTSRIRITMSTSDPVNSPLKITEILVEGTETGESFTNLAQGITAVSNRSSSSDTSLAALTDGNTSSLWKTAGNDYPVEAEISLPNISYADSVEVHFECDQTPFKFNVMVTDENGNETKISPQECENHTNVLEEKSYKMDVKKNISKVKVTLLGSTGVGEHYGFWPALAEIKVMGTPPEPQEEPAVDLTGKNVSGITVSGGNATNNVLDGNRESFDRVAENQNIEFDLHGTYYLSHVNLVFEKGELGLRYKVLAQDASGQEITLCDASQSTELLGDRTVRVPVGREVKKIIFIHMGNNGMPPAALAEKRLYEFEACGVEKTDSGSITITPSDAQGLLTGSAEYTVAANSPVTMTLNKAEDINMIRILRGADETKALKYKAEYYDEAEKNWKTFADLSDNAGAGSESCAVADGIVYTKQIRITFTESVAISGLNLYTTDYAGILTDRINAIRAVLDGAAYGTNKGQYREEAKTAAEAVLARAESATGVTSQTIDEWLDMVNEALDNFYETGVVYLDRNGVLLAMADAKELIEKQTQYEQTEGQDALQEAYETARGIYETYNLTQSDLDAAQTVLNTKIDEIKASVGTAIDQKEIADAKKDLSNLKEQEENENRKKQDYTPASWREYEKALAAVNTIQGNSNATKEEIAAAKFQLQQAIWNLKDSTSVLVESIALEAAKTDLTVGESVRITARILPAEADDKTLIWSSGSESIAAISSADQENHTCLVTAKAEGTVKITAQAQDESEVTGEITLKITKAKGKTDPIVYPAVGRIHKTADLEYKITASGESVRTVMVEKSLQKKAKKIVIPPTVTIDGFEYKVTEIKAKAFNKNKKITQAAIGANVEIIGKQAFNGCKNLKKITITSAVIKKINKKAFAGIKKKAVITVPKAQFKNYKNYLKKAKTEKTAKIKKK